MAVTGENSGAESHLTYKLVRCVGETRFFYRCVFFVLARSSDLSLLQPGRWGCVSMSRFSPSCSLVFVQ